MLSPLLLVHVLLRLRLRLLLLLSWTCNYDTTQPSTATATATAAAAAFAFSSPPTSSRSSRLRLSLSLPTRRKIDRGTASRRWAPTSWRQRILLSLSLSSTTTFVDYEYIPPNSDDDISSNSNTITDDTPGGYSHLPSSSFPRDAPAGLRGEAIRSALRSTTNCIGWKLDNTCLAYGLIQVTGQGCIPFLNNKLSVSFGGVDTGDAGGADNNNMIATTTTTTTTGRFQRACLLNGKGRIVDMLGVAITTVTATSKEDGATTVTAAYVLTSPGHSSSELSTLR